MYEIDVCAVTDALQQRVSFLYHKGVPAHVRDLKAVGESGDAALYDAEAFVQAPLIALLIQHWHAQADTQYRHIRPDTAQDDVPERRDLPHAALEGAHARKHEGVGGID